MKDLGVIIDKVLNFEFHIQEKINKNKANRTMGMIRRAVAYIVEEMFFCLFKAFVKPHIECANTVRNTYYIISLA